VPELTDAHLLQEVTATYHAGQLTSSATCAKARTEFNRPIQRLHHSRMRVAENHRPHDSTYRHIIAVHIDSSRLLPLNEQRIPADGPNARTGCSLRPQHCKAFLKYARDFYVFIPSALSLPNSAGRFPRQAPPPSCFRFFSNIRTLSPSQDTQIPALNVGAEPHADILQSPLDER
jgi:hypothetical protein